MSSSTTTTSSGTSSACRWVNCFFQMAKTGQTLPSSIQSTNVVTDLHICAGSEEVSVHKNVLTSVSPFIRDLLSSAPFVCCACQGRECGHTGDVTIVVPDADARHVRMLVELLYTGETATVTQDVVGDREAILAVAEALGVVDLSESSVTSVSKKTPEGRRTRKRRHSGWTLTDNKTNGTSGKSSCLSQAMNESWSPSSSFFSSFFSREEDLRGRK